MNLLQKLIKQKIDEGVSMREIARQSHVGFRSVYDYYHQGVEPRGKNLGLLSDYFGVHFADLLDHVKGSGVPGGSAVSQEKKLLWEEIEKLSNDEALELLLQVRKERQVRGKDPV